MWDVIVIGAGLAGLTCAQQLQQAGYGVLVVDKSRGLGGRLATRRVQQSGQPGQPQQPVDHGCPYLQPTPETEALLAQLQAADMLQRWQPQEFQLTADGAAPQPVSAPYWTAADGMTAVAKALAEGLTVRRSCQVQRVEPGESWQLYCEADPEPLRGRGVAIATPAPQARDLLRALSAGPTATYAPCLTVLAGYDALPAPWQRPWLMRGAENSPILWAALDSSKPQRPTDSLAVVAHSAPDFAAAHLQADDLSAVGQTLLATLPWQAAPIWMQVHRWRYSRVLQPHPQPHWSLPDYPTLVGCGDWCGGQDAGAAITSGRAAAAALRRHLT